MLVFAMLIVSMILLALGWQRLAAAILLAAFAVYYLSAYAGFSDHPQLFPEGAGDD